MPTLEELKTKKEQLYNAYLVAQRLAEVTPEALRAQQLGEQSRLASITYFAAKQAAERQEILDRKAILKAEFDRAANDMKNLSPMQQYVVDRMREGWQLRGHWGLTGTTWLYKDHETENVRTKTFFALRDRGLLVESRVGDKALYTLNEEAPE